MQEDKIFLRFHDLELINAHLANVLIFFLGSTNAFGMFVCERLRDLRKTNKYVPYSSIK